MTRQAAAIAYDSSGNFALTLSVADATLGNRVVDTGTTSCPDNERSEALTTLLASDVVAKSTQYASGLTTHSQTDSLSDLHDNIAAAYHNTNVIYAPTVRFYVLAEKNTFYTPSVRIFHFTPALLTNLNVFRSAVLGIRKFTPALFVNQTVFRTLVLSRSVKF